MLWWKLRQLKSSNPQTRLEAARNLGESREARAVPALISVLGDEASEVRRAAARALRILAHPASAEPLSSALARACSQPGAHRSGAPEPAEPSELAEAAAALGRDAVEPLVRLLAHDSKEVRRWACHALGLAGDGAARDPLVGRLSDARSEVRREAALALGRIQDPGTLSPLIAALGNRDPDTRRAAAEALGNLGSEHAVDALVKAAEDPSEPIQLAAVGALGRIGTIGAAAGLRKVADATSRKAVREAAAAALAAIRADNRSTADLARLAVLAGRFEAAVAQGPVAVPAFVEALESRDPRRRLKAVDCLAALHPAEAAGPVARLLADSDRTIAEAACRALVRIGNAALPDLERTLEGPDASAQRLSAEAMGQIGDSAATGALCRAIASNRDAVTDYPDPHEAARAAHASLCRILDESAARCAIDALLAASEVPDAVLRRPGSRGEPESVLDCSRIRDIAREELHRRR